VGLKPIPAIVLSVLAALSSAGTTSAQARNPSADVVKSSDCSVAGTVVKLAGSVPLKSATVRLQSMDDSTRTYSGVTDASGHFEIKGITSGPYRMRVVRNGFVTQEYGQRTPSDPGAILVLGSGQDLKDLLFRLEPSAVITGRIQNEDGEPLPWVRVSALRETYSRGKRKLTSEVTVVTNDLGEYRLFGLRPGRYFVSAAYRPGQRLDTDEDDEQGEATGQSGYVTTYYPGSPDPAKAVAVAVKAGEEIAATDVMMEPAAVYSVRGRVNNFVSRRAAAGAILALEPRTSGLGWSMPARQMLVDKPDGSFEIHGVLPGSYTLSANWFDEGRRYQARQAIEVTNADLEGVQLAIAPGMNVQGQVVWDPKPSLEKDALTVSATGADSSLVFGTRTRVGPNGAFYLGNLSEGLYRLAISGQTADCYLKSIRYAGMEAADDEFNVIRGTQATLELTISAKGARVQGAVRDEDGVAAAGVWVALVPDEAHRTEFHLFKQRTTDQYGRFEFRGIAPGDYKLFSWEQVEANAWEDPEFLKPFEAKGTSVSLQENHGKTVDLVAIRTASNEQQKP
jgi:hypothetical protein